MLDIQMTIAQKPKKKLYSTMAAMGFVHKEVRGGINHSHTIKEVTGNSNSFNPNQPTLRDLVYGQAKINESIHKKLATNKKSLETIHAKMDGFPTAIKNQLSFNKMPAAELGKIPGLPESTLESVNAVTTRSVSYTHLTLPTIA